MKKYPLEPLNQADKILFVMNETQNQQKSDKIPFRHTQISNLVIGMAGEGKYQNFTRSSRTYYKKYAELMQNGFLQKIKERQTGRNYNAYVITDKGIAYIKAKIKNPLEYIDPSKLRLDEPINNQNAAIINKSHNNQKKQNFNNSQVQPRYKSINKSPTIQEEQENHVNLQNRKHQGDGDTLESQSQKNSPDIEKNLSEISVTSNSQPESDTQHTTKGKKFKQISLVNIGSKGDNSGQEKITGSETDTEKGKSGSLTPNQINLTNLSESPSNSDQISDTIAKLVLKKIGSALSNSINHIPSYSNKRSSFDSDQSIQTGKNNTNQQKNQKIGDNWEDINHEIDEDWNGNDLDTDNLDDFLDTNTQNNNLEAQVENNIGDASSFQKNPEIFRKRKKFIEPRMIEIPVPKPEDQYKLLSNNALLEKLISTNETREEQLILDYVKKSGLDNLEKAEYFIQILKKHGVNESNIEFLIDQLQMDQNSIAEAITTLQDLTQKDKIPFSALILVEYFLSLQIIPNIHQTQLVRFNSMNIFHTQMSYQDFFNLTLDHLMRINEQGFPSYAYALHLLEGLHGKSFRPSENQVLIELKIFLNLREFDKIIGFISHEKILSTPWSNKSIYYIIFRSYYELGDFQSFLDLTAQNDTFPISLIRLAKSEIRIQENPDILLKPTMIGDLFKNLMEDHFPCNPDRESMIEHFLKQLQQGTLSYYLFAIHFINWLRNYDENDGRWIELLKTWWKGIKTSNSELLTYITLQEEILTYLEKFDLAHSLEYTKVLRWFQEYREDQLNQLNNLEI